MNVSIHIILVGILIFGDLMRILYPLQLGLYRKQIYIYFVYFLYKDSHRAIPVNQYTVDNEQTEIKICNSVGITRCSNPKYIPQDIEDEQIIVGGMCDTVLKNTIWSINLKNNILKELKPIQDNTAIFLEPRELHMAIKINNDYIHILGGFNNNGICHDIIEYHIPTYYWRYITTNGPTRAGAICSTVENTCKEVSNDRDCLCMYMCIYIYTINNYYYIYYTDPNVQIFSGTNGVGLCSNVLTYRSAPNEQKICDKCSNISGLNSVPVTLLRAPSSLLNNSSPHTPQVIIEQDTDNDGQCPLSQFSPSICSFVDELDISSTILDTIEETDKVSSSDELFCIKYFLFGGYSPQGATNDAFWIRVYRADKKQIIESAYNNTT